MSELTNFIARRGVLKAQLTRLNTYVNGLNVISDEVLSQLYCRSSKLEHMWEAFEQVQVQIDCLSDDPEVQNLERENFETNYFNLASKIKLTIKNAEKERSVVSDTSSVANLSVPNVDSTNKCEIRLPIIELRTFSGKFLEWIEFRSSFEGLIHNNDKLSNIQKFYYLKSAVKDEAATLLQDLELSENNYNIAWDLLITRFENKQAIINQHIKTILDITPVQRESLSGLRNIHDVSLKNIKSLKSVHEAVDHWDLVIIHILTNKLDTVTRRELERKAQKSSLPTLKQFHEFILNK